ncbi:MAG TPA: hypothetical protein VK788_19530 [Terriglobales bacterium]|jgi:hypothetical protein|nr:hypothetical protein [Terriglobales bacterium]
MRLPFCILNVLGDVLDNGELYFVEAAQTLDAAKAGVQSLGEACPGEYVIYGEGTVSALLLLRAAKATECCFFFDSATNAPFLQRIQNKFAVGLFGLPNRRRSLLTYFASLPELSQASSSEDFRAIRLGTLGGTWPS